MDERMLEQWLDAIDTIEEVKFDLIRHEDDEDHLDYDYDNQMDDYPDHRDVDY